MSNSADYALRGNHTINIDGKGRLAIPTKYREKFHEVYDNKFVITKDQDRCLLLYPLSEWKIVERKLLEIPVSSRQATLFKRFMIGNASECEMDSHGKILIPEKLRLFGNLDKRIVLSGQINKFEIWAEDAWEAESNEWMEEGSLDKLMEAVGNLSI